MPSQPPESPTPSNPAPNRIAEFLEFLRTAGPAALEDHGQPGIKKVALRRLDLVWNTPLHYATTITSDDLLSDLKSLDPALDPFTSGATVAGATLEFAFDDCHLPHLVRIRSPHAAEFQFQQDAARVFAWMDQRRSRLVNQVANTTALLLLAFAAALAPALGDGDNDGDDLENDRHHQMLSARLN